MIVDWGDDLVGLARVRSLTLMRWYGCMVKIEKDSESDKKADEIAQ